MLEDSNQKGGAALANLYDQGKKLEKIQGGLDEIDSDLEESERNLRNIKSIFGGMTNWFRKTKEPQPSVRKTSFSSSSSSSASSSKVPESSKISKHTPKGVEKSPLSRDEFVPPEEDEVSENLDKMQPLLSNLKEMALQFGTEIDRQNKSIEKLDEMTESNISKIKKNNAAMRKMI